MRILHTADWHAGRTLRGVERTPEIYDALREILEIAKSERVDAILVSGDLFDTPNPRPEAEAAVYNFFLETGQLGIPSVVIAGNHDSPQRLESVAGLLRRVSVAAVGTIKSNTRLAINLENSKGEKAVIATMPFLSERRLVKSAQLLDGDVGQWRMKYQEGMDFFIKRMEKEFRANTINLMMLHTTIEGGSLSGSEFKFLTQNSYTIRADQLPASAQYVALGHLHKPQRVNDAPPAEYAGSLIQLDFGEAGEQKYVKLIDVAPGRPAFVESIPIRSGKQLRAIRANLENLERQLEEYKDFDGYLKVAVKVQQPLPGLKDRVLAVLPQALAVEVELEEGAQQAIAEAASNVTPMEAFERYIAERRSGGLSEEVRAAFVELFEQSQDATAPDSAPAEAPAARATLSETFTLEEKDSDVLRAGPHNLKDSSTNIDVPAVETALFNSEQGSKSKKSKRTGESKTDTPKTEMPKPAAATIEASKLEPEKLAALIDNFVASTPDAKTETLNNKTATSEASESETVLEPVAAVSALTTKTQLEPVSLEEFEFESPSIATPPMDFEDTQPLPLPSESAEIRRKRILDWDDDDETTLADHDLQVLDKNKEDKA